MPLEKEIGDAATALSQNQYIDALDGTYWVDGWDATLGAGDFEVDIAPGEGAINTVDVETTETQAVDFADDVDADDPRKAVISVDDTGTVQKTLGDAMPADPVDEVRERTIDPSPPTNAPGVVLAEVWLAAGATALVGEDVRDRRLTNRAGDSTSVFYQNEEPSTTPEPSPGGPGGLWFKKSDINDWLSVNRDPFEIGANAANNRNGLEYRDGRVYLSEVNADDAPNRLYPVEVPSGDVPWRFESESTGANFRSATASDEDRVYAGTQVDSNGTDLGYLYAINRQDGTEDWRLTTDEDWRGQITVTDSHIYTGTQDDTGLRKIDKTNGDVVWNFPERVQGEIVVDDGAVYFGDYLESDKWYRLDDSDGSVVWDSFDSRGWTKSVQTDDEFVYFAVERDEQVAAVDKETGETEWSFTDMTDDVDTDLLLDGGVLYFADDDGFAWALDASDGTEIWSTQLADTPTSDSNVFIKDGVLLMSTNEVFYEIEPSDGTILNETPYPSNTSTTFTLGEDGVFAFDFDNNEDVPGGLIYYDFSERFAWEDLRVSDGDNWTPKA